VNIQTDELYCILDNSQLSNLLSKNNFSYLNSVKFLQEYGFPIIFYEHLIETGQNDSLCSFLEKMKKLSSVTTFKSLNIKNTLPPRIVDLFEYEIILRNEYGNIDINRLKKELSTKIVNCHLTNNDFGTIQFFQSINNSAQVDKKVWLVLNSINTESFFKERIVELTEDNLKFHPTRQIYALLHALLPIKDRFKKQEENDKLVNNYFYEIEEKKYVPSLEFTSQFRKAVKKGVEKKQTIEDFFYDCMFESFKVFALKNNNVQESKNKELTYNDTLLWKLFFDCLRDLTSTYQKDKERKIELSDIYDIYFLCCSILFKVFVDKRTFDLGKRMESKLGIQLNIVKSIEMGNEEVVA